jgi:hypothetical protein
MAKPSFLTEKELVTDEAENQWGELPVGTEERMAPAATTIPLNSGL